MIDRILEGSSLGSIVFAVIALVVAIVAVKIALDGRRRARDAVRRIKELEADELTPRPREDWRTHVL